MINTIQDKKEISKKLKERAIKEGFSIAGIASIPARKISMLKAPAKKESEIIAQPTLEMMGISSQPSGE